MSLPESQVILVHSRSFCLQLAKRLHHAGTYYVTPLMHYHKWVSAQLWRTSLHPGNRATRHKSHLWGRGGIWGSDLSLTSFHIRHSQLHPPPRGRLCRPMIPPQMLLKPQSNTFNSPRWHCPSGWQSRPGQADPAKMRLLVGWGAGQCVLAWKAHGSLLPRVTHLSSWALSLCVSPRNSQDTLYPTVSQCLHQDTLWPRGIAMCCYMQVYPLAFADLGSRGGGTTGKKAVPGVKAPGERYKRENGCRRGWERNQKKFT